MSTRATRWTLGGIALAALALAGLPEVLPAGAPPGVLRGVVVDSAGYALPGAQVYLFAGDSERPRAETRTDAAGGFDFAFVPPLPRVFVRAPEGSGRLDACGPAPGTRGPLAFVLHRARPLTVRVSRPEGLSLAGLEVRVHEARGESSVLALARTDGEGRAVLGAPARAHVVVEERDTGLFRWSYDVAVPESGRELTLELPASRPLAGTVRVDGRPRAGLALTLHGGVERVWSSATRSDEHGRFLLARPPGPFTVTVRDPLGRVLPGHYRIAPELDGELALEAEEGAPQVVRTTRGGRPLAARVHLWSPELELLGPGLRTNGSGRIELAVPPQFTLITAPLDEVQEPMLVPDLARSERELALDLARER